MTVHFRQGGEATGDALAEAQQRRYNPPGQSALTYRVGTYGSFVQQLLELAPEVTISDGPNRGARPLASLNTSAYRDWVIALLKVWSMVGDVLTFYQERIANEGYLRTATEEKSVRELVRSIGYEPRPGAAASTYLAFTLMDARGAPERVSIPIGTSVQGSAEPGQLPATFETGEAVEARPAWNTLAPYIPPLSRPPELGPDTREVWIKGIRPGLQPGLPLLFMSAGTAGGPAAARIIRTLQKADPDPARGATRLIWDEPLGGAGPLVEPRVFVLRQRASLFGHNAASWDDLPTTTREEYAVRQGGLLRSTDNGTAWNPANHGLPGTVVQALVADRRGQVFAGTAEGLLRSADGGRTWAAVAAGPTRKDVHCLTLGDDGYLLAGTAGGEIYRSTDAGASWDLLRGGIQLDRGGRGWKPVNARFPRTVIRALLTVRTRDGQSNLLAGTDRGVLRSADGGNAWRAASRGLPGHDRSTGLANVVVHALTLDPAGKTLLAGTDRGVFASDDLGGHWKPVNQGLPDTPQTVSLFTRIWRAITRQFRRTAPPAPTTTAGSSLVVYALVACENPSNRQRYWLAGTDQGCFISMNGGTHWSPANQGMATGGDLPAVRALAVSSDLGRSHLRLFAGTDRGVFRSDDAGTTWSLATGGEVRALLVEGTETIWAATPPDGFAETEWPGFELTDGEIDLDKTYGSVLAGSWVVLSQGQPTSRTDAFAAREVTTVSRADFGRSGTITRITTDPTAALADFGLRNTIAFVGSEQLALQDVQTPWLEPIQGKAIRLAGIHSELRPGQRVCVTGPRPQPRPTGAPAGAPAFDRASPSDPHISEIARIQAVTIAPGGVYTTLTLEGVLRGVYDPFATTVGANVAPATHGETVRFEILGSGDSSKANQRFVLKKPPLTFLPSAMPGGVTSTLSVYVHPALGQPVIPIPGVTPAVSLEDAVQWQEVPSLYTAGARDAVFEVRRDDTERPSVIFGDGERGARLPTGVENVIATYRTGLGPAGNLGANRLVTLKSRPPGVRQVTNPVPAAGGEPPESADLARSRAPATTRSLGRIVSLRDYEDFAAGFAGVGKARVQELESGAARLIQLSVAGENGTQIDRSSSLYLALVEAVERERVPGGRVRIDPYEPVYFNLEATILVEPDHLTEPVLGAVEAALTTAYRFDRREFGQDLTASDVVTLIQGVAGVRAVRLDALYRDGEPRALRAELIAKPARWEAGEVKPAQLILINAPEGIALTAGEPA